MTYSAYSAPQRPAINPYSQQRPGQLPAAGQMRQLYDDGTRIPPQLRKGGMGGPQNMPSIGAGQLPEQPTGAYGQPLQPIGAGAPRLGGYQPPTPAPMMPMQGQWALNQQGMDNFNGGAPTQGGMTLQQKLMMQRQYPQLSHPAMQDQPWWMQPGAKVGF